MDYIKNPGMIETRSFEIITEELGSKNEMFEGANADIAKRVIHTTADFEYADLIYISDDAYESAVNALKQGCKIYADTTMIISGVNKRILKEYGCEIYSLIADEEVAKEAKEKGITRSIAGINRAVKDDKTEIYLIGNAPTALFTLKSHIDSGNVSPALTVAVPVGFVGAAESKEEFMSADVPKIVIRGRKGGSTVAVSIINAILYRMKREDNR